MFHLTNFTPSDLSHRPLFLSILCLLTFFGSLTGLVFNSLGYFNSETLVNRIAAKDSNSHLRVLDYSNGDLTNPSIRVGNINEDNYKKFSVGGTVSYILSLVGSVLMFKGKRNGFYSLVLGVFFNLISHFLLFGDNFRAMGLSMLFTLLALIMVVIFCMNLKYLEEE